MQEQASEFAAFIGIDWADRKHDVCLQIPGAHESEASVLEHRPRAIDAWARQLRERFGGRPIAVCLELAQGPIVSALLEYEFFVIFPVNPSTLAKYRRAFVPSGAKDDPTDAALALELLRRHPEKLAPLRRESADMRALRRLVEARRDLVQDRVRVTNRLTFTLKDYFPQMSTGFGTRRRMSSLPSSSVGRRCKPLNARAVTPSSPSSTRTASGDASAIDRRINAIQAERPLTSDPLSSSLRSPSSRRCCRSFAPSRPASPASIADIAQRCAAASRLPACSSTCPVPAPCSPPACSPRSVSSASASPTLPPCRSALASLPSPNAAATSTGFTGAGPAQPSSGRPSSSGSASSISAFLLGPRLLRQPQSQGLVPQRHHPCSRLQVDPDPLSLLGRPHPLQRIPLPLRPPETPVPAAQIRRRPAFIIRLRSASGRGLGGAGRRRPRLAMPLVTILGADSLGPLRSQ